MIGANTHQRCTDFDRDAAIWVVGFRERLMACARSGGQIRVSGALVRVAVTSVLKRPLRCTDFGQNAEILGPSGSESDCGSGSLKMAGQTYLPAITRQIGVDFPPPYWA
jgi:hypothetical protein